VTRAGGNVDVVDADREVGHDPEAGARRVEQLVVDPVGEHRAEPLDTRGGREKLRAGSRALGVVHGQLEALLELANHAVRDTAGEVDTRSHRGGSTVRLPASRAL
jgi:hypothetical protein